ncbi:MAG TPA: ABC transporter ATP-binding protein [Rhodospirillales bacterium]|nr:ABC transporter ATP-binding protein [Rhodospirillales bacterium]
MNTDFKETIQILRRIKMPLGTATGAISLSIMFAVMEGAGIGLLLPILLFVQDRGKGVSAISADPMLGALAKGMAMIGLPMTLMTLITMAVTPLLLRQLISYYKVVVTSRAEYQYQANIRCKILDHFLKAGMPFFVQSTQGSVSAAVLQDVNRASIILRSIIEIIEITILLLVYFGLLLILSPVLTLMALPFFAMATFMISRQLRKGRFFGGAIAEQMQSLNDAVNETFNGIRLVKMRGFEEQTFHRLKAMLNTVKESSIGLQRIQATLEARSQPILIIGTFFVLFIAVEMLDMKLAELGMFLFLTSRSAPLLIRLNSSRLAVSGGMESHLRIERMQERAERFKDVTSGNAPFTGLRNTLAFKDVSFAYIENGKPALDRVSFEITKGATMAIVGPSGAGKSTLVDLLPRFHDPLSGRIEIDGTPIATFDLKSLRRGIAFVSQDPVMFHDTLRNNLQIGLPTPLTEEELHSCMKGAHCLEFVEQLPQGVDTVIGEHGQRLSGGQRQRLAIARALAQPLDILILDEPTSALDSESELEIKAMLKNLHGRITVIIIAHRMSTIRGVDWNLVLEDGKVAGTGSHEELMASCGIYKKLVESQKL